MDKMREEFDALCNALPDGVSWGDPLTVDIAKAISLAAHAPAVSGEAAAVQELFVHEDGCAAIQPDSPLQDGDKPFCRFAEYHDSGDQSAGIPARTYWALTDNQEGTALADLLAAVKQPAPDGEAVYVPTQPASAADQAVYDSIAANYNITKPDALYLATIAEVIARIEATTVVDGESVETFKKALIGRVSDMAKPTYQSPAQAAPDGEAVEWQFRKRCLITGQFGYWQKLEKEEYDHMSANSGAWEGYEIRALYTRPAPDAQLALDEAMIAAVDHCDAHGIALDLDTLEGIVRAALAAAGKE